MITKFLDLLNYIVLGTQFKFAVENQKKRKGMRSTRTDTSHQVYNSENMG